jgi:ferrochelatase
MTAPVGVLLLAYGSPERPEEVEAYFTHIRGGRPPSPEAVEHLRERYRRVGGRTPLLQITEAVRDGLETELNRQQECQYRVYAAMKHWHPFTADVMAGMAADGIRRVIVVALAPHYSRISIGGYQRGVTEAQERLGAPFQVAFVEHWHLEPGFLELIADHVQSARHGFADTPDARLVTVFTAHSLPVRIREWHDPYEEQLLASSRAVAGRAQLTDWRFAWQSAGSTGEPWIGPDILEMLETLSAEGVTHVLQVPIGFVSDHLEILYDVDIEAAEKSSQLGLAFRRTALPNASPAFVRVLADIVERTVREPVTTSAAAST